MEICTPQYREQRAVTSKSVECGEWSVESYRIKNIADKNYPVNDF